MKDLKVLEKLANDSFNSLSQEERENMVWLDYVRGYVWGWNDCEKSRKKATIERIEPECKEYFDQFWKEYPGGIRGKSGKKPTLLKWIRINPNKSLFEKIIEAVKRYKETEQWQKDGGKYIPNPLTFLNQARWEDEIPERTKSWTEFK